jgi:hypothetical protein
MRTTERRICKPDLSRLNGPPRALARPIAPSGVSVCVYLSVVTAAA